MNKLKNECLKTFTEAPPTMRMGDEVIRVTMRPGDSSHLRCHACFRFSAIIFVRIICMEGSATDGSKGRRCKLGKTQTPTKPQETRIANLVPSAPPAQPDDVDLTEVREAIFEITGIYWACVEVTKIIQELNKRGIRVDNVQLRWIVQESRTTALSQLARMRRPRWCWYPISRGQQVKEVKVGEK